MEFLVEFDVSIPPGAADSEVRDRQEAESAAAARLAREGHLVRVWRLTAAGPNKVLGLYRAGSDTQLDELLRALPLYDWMRVTVTPLGSHPNDPGADGSAT
jgi:muconolactone D-isomerase